MRHRRVFRASDLQVVDASSSGVVSLPRHCRLDLEIASSKPFQVRALAGPVEAVLAYGTEVRLQRDLEGFDQLVVVASTAQVTGWMSVAERRDREVLDPTPVAILSPEEFEASLTVDQLIRRELARYHRARLEGDGDPDDGLEFDDEGDDLDLPEADDDEPPSGAQGEPPPPEDLKPSGGGGGYPEPAPEPEE